MPRYPGSSREINTIADKSNKEADQTALQPFVTSSYGAMRLVGIPRGILLLQRLEKTPQAHHSDVAQRDLCLPPHRLSQI